MKFWNKDKRMQVPPPEPGDEATIDTPSDERRWVGYIDKVDRSIIQGWCFDRANPMVSLAVEAIGTKGSHVIAIACLFRSDVKEGGYGTGNYGFELKVADFDDTESVTVRFVESRAPINLVPIALDPINALCTNVLPEELIEATQQLARAVDLRHLGLQSAGEATAPHGFPYDACLLQPFDPPTDPEGLITCFTAQEGARIVRDAFDLEITGSLQERLGILLWYVDGYAASRPFTAKVPLSDRQIVALNTPASIAGSSGAVTVVLHNFVLRHLPSHADLRDERLLREATYWWCVEQAPLHRLDDRLVTREQVDLLSAVERGAGTEFPCTSFMMLYAQRHAELRDLNLDLPRDRLALLGYLVLASFLQPGYLRFLPREALRRLLRGDSEGRNAIEPILGRLAATDDQQDIAALGREVRRKGEDLLSAVGLALTSHRLPVGAPTGGATPRKLDLRPGVTVIGPSSKSSGLGRAMRLSLEALAATETIPPASVDFGMENPAPGGEGQPSPLVALDGPREITLLHLNAEALPLAFAFGPRHLLAGSYRIGYFFWELNEIPECHRLALDLVDEIWVASEFNREIYAKATAKPVIRIGMSAASLPDVAPASRAAFGLETDSFVFIAAFDSLSFIARKNPFGVIEAFRLAFPLGTEPVQLLLKTQNRGAVFDAWQVRTWRRIDRAIAADPRIVLVDETLVFADLVALTRACDAYVSLHRSEGWGFGLIEAMQLGLPVICTGYSGNADFCNDDTAFIVEHTLIPVAAEEYIYVPRGSVWADPSTASAAAQMRQVMVDRGAAARKAETARAFVATHLSPETTARRYAERLAAIRGRDGKAAC